MGASGAPDEDRGREQSGVLGAPGSPGSRTIGAVLAALTPDFPDLTISKIRFLEAEGLVTPHRAGSGYRTYTDRDIERLRYVLTAQRDRFWPLKVIRDALDAMDRGLTPGEPEGSDARPRVPEGASDPDVPTALALAAPATLRLTARSCATRPASTGPPSMRWRTTAWSGPMRAATSTTTPWPSPARPPPSPHTVSSPGTCARSGPPPTARSGWSSRSCGRRGRLRAVRAGPTAPHPRTRRPRCCACASRCIPLSSGPAPENAEPRLTKRSREK